MGATVGHAEHSGDLREVHRRGQEDHHLHGAEVPVHPRRDRQRASRATFAIIIDEAHSSQGGELRRRCRMALSAAGAEEEDETIEDKINRLMEAKKLLPNASYFAFTATPKNKTLEIFGEPEPQADGKVKHRPFHSYTMKQAIQEGFILDVLKHYTPVESYYKLVKKVEGDPEFDTKRAKKKLRRYVESHDHAIRLKAEIMVDHFHEQVIALNKIGGQARAMVVTSGIERAIQYFHAIRDYLAERKSPLQGHRRLLRRARVRRREGDRGSLNGFPSSQIADQIQEDPYRFLICADKFQTGYDEPLLHTMYVDKVLSGIKAVQTLSRLNRAHPKKHDVFVLDFMNDIGHDPGGVRRLLPHDDPGRGDRPEQAPRPQGGARRLSGLFGRADRRSWSRSISAGPTATSSIRSSTPAWPCTAISSTKTVRWTSRARPRLSSAPTASWPSSCSNRTHQRPH